MRLIFNFRGSDKIFLSSQKNPSEICKFQNVCYNWCFFLPIENQVFKTSFFSSRTGVVILLEYPGVLATDLYETNLVSQGIGRVRLLIFGVRQSCLWSDVSFAKCFWAPPPNQTLVLSAVIGKKIHYKIQMYCIWRNWLVVFKKIIDHYVLIGLKCWYIRSKL